MREKKAVIGGVWCLSNTERLVMIPLAPHTETGTQREGETGGGHKARDREGANGSRRERRDKKRRL